jgi:prepilin signal peptidase PulO-like enzyme (type II secretory pathway)
MLIIFFILGLIVGSFLNVVVYRLNVAETILGRSKCPQCKKQIRWYDNVPLLSFVLLKARCRDCAEKISWQYPLVELLTGVLFAVVGSLFFSLQDSATWIPTAYFLVLLSALIIIAVYDALYLEIPGIVLWPAIGWVVAFLLFQDWGMAKIASPLALATYSGLIAAFGAFLFFFALSAGSGERWMGEGDAYLAILLGLALGWPKILPAFLLSFTLGAAVGVLLIVFQKKNLKSQLPFAPFFVTGAILALFWGSQIISAYERLFNFY